MRIDESTYTRMGTTPWSLSLEGTIEFHDRITPAGYNRPDYWHPCFYPRVWREEAPPYWQKFVIGIQLSIAAYDQESFNWYYAKAMQELESEEFIHHLEDYCTTAENEVWLALQRCFQLPPSLDSSPQSLLDEAELAELMRLSIERDIEGCHHVCARLIEAGQQFQVFDLIQELTIAERDADHEILSAVMFALLGQAECERLLNQAVDRMEGIESLSARLAHLDRLYRL